MVENIENSVSGQSSENIESSNMTADESAAHDSLLRASESGTIAASTDQMTLELARAIKDEGFMKFAGTKIGNMDDAISKAPDAIAGLHEWYQWHQKQA